MNKELNVIKVKISKLNATLLLNLLVVSLIEDVTKVVGQRNVL